MERADLGEILKGRLVKKWTEKGEKKLKNGRRTGSIKKNEKPGCNV